MVAQNKASSNQPNGDVYVLFWLCNRPWSSGPGSIRVTPFDVAVSLPRFSTHVRPDSPREFRGDWGRLRTGPGQEDDARVILEINDSGQEAGKIIITREGRVLNVDQEKHPDFTVYEIPPLR